MTNIKLELDELKRLTDELRDIKEDGSDNSCPNCKRYASIAYKAAEKYYEILIRAEIIEATWYKKGGIDCDKIQCDCKKENIALKQKIEEASTQLHSIITSSIVVDKEDKTKK